jgi:hypothetical protein
MSTTLESDLTLAHRKFLAAAQFAASPAALEVIAEGARQGLFAQSLDLLAPELACLVAAGGEPKDVRAELEHNVKAGVIQKYTRGGAVLFSRSEIVTAIKSGQWRRRGK